MQEATQISERRACRLVGIHRASKRYISSREEAEGSQLQACIKEIALERRRLAIAVFTVYYVEKALK